MTPTEARTQLQKALDAALPQCFVPVSAQALAVLLEETEPPEEPDAHD